MKRSKRSMDKEFAECFSFLADKIKRENQMKPIEMKPIEWKKCPSVMTGGKQYFWFTRLGETDIFCGRRYWVSWDRKMKNWKLENSRDKILYASDKKKEVFNWANNYLEMEVRNA